MMACPILDDLQSSGNNLRRTLHRIQKDLARCRMCGNNPCPARSAFNELIQRTVRETLAELQEADSGRSSPAENAGRSSPA
jgi:hypothetical protein